MPFESVDEPDIPPEDESTPDAGPAVAADGLEAVKGMTAPPDRVDDPVTCPAVIGALSPLLFVADPTTTGEVTPEGVVPETGEVAVAETTAPLDNVAGPVAEEPILAGILDGAVSVLVTPLLTGRLD